MLSMEELIAMRQMDVMEADRNYLADIRNVNIDTNKPVREKVLEFLNAVHNPYLVLSGDCVLKFDYDDRGGKDIDDRMFIYISKMADLNC